MIEESKASKTVKAKAAKIRKKVGLTRRFVALSVAPAIVIPLMLIVFSRINTTYSMTQSYSDEALSLAGAYGTAVENLMQSLSEEFNVVTMNPSAVDESLSLDERKNILAQTAHTSIFKDFSVAYADGKTYNDTDISQREYFKYSMANKSYYVSSPVLRMTDNSLTIMMGRYFNSNGKDYLAYGGLDTETFNRVIEKVHFGDSGICYILDKDGAVIASSNKDLLPILAKPLDGFADENLSGITEISEKMMSEKEGTALASFNGEKYIFGYMPISGGEGWTIAVGGSFAPAEKNIFWAVLLFSIITAVNVCILVPVVIRRIKLVCKPIEASAVRLRRLTEGDIASPAPECKSGDETELLTDSLSEMISSLNGYILDIRNVLTAISSGDLTAKPSVEYTGDFSEIRRALDLILLSLNRTMAEVGRSAQEVRDGAEHLANGSSELSQNAVAQASVIDEIASTVRDISEKTEANCRNVEKALEATGNATLKAQDGSRCMEDLLTAIGEIEQSAEEIKKIIKVIDDIAFQTNILALNAAIEAARAGEAGKGFAVVADEVRNLAAKSSEAAQQTGDLIAQSIEAVERGTAFAQTTSSALSDIVSGVDDVSGAMNEISRASDEQAAAVEQISVGMTRVEEAIHKTTAGAEQSAAASEQLSALSATLDDAVSRFHVKED